jgi:hypothetical protein
MKLLVKLLDAIIILVLHLFKFLYFWVAVLPFRYSLLAVFLNFGISLLLFGEAGPNKILEDQLVLRIIANITIGIPMLFGFFTFIGGSASETGSGVHSSINDAIEYRNLKMRHASGAEAYEIIKKSTNQNGKNNKLYIVQRNNYYEVLGYTENGYDIFIF